MIERTYRRPDKVIVYLYRRLQMGQVEYLLMQRAPSARAGSIWQTVVGAARWGEELVEAARREVYEETGLTRLQGITAIGYAFSFSLSSAVKTSDYPPDTGEIHNTVFAAEVVSNRPIRISDEHIAYGWFPYGEALRRIHWPEEREALRLLHPMLVSESDERGASPTVA